MKIIPIVFLLVGGYIPMSLNMMSEVPCLYAPWRTVYKTDPIPSDSSMCSMCRIASKNAGIGDFQLLYTPYFVVALNVFPYSQGHVLIVPHEHTKKMQELNAQARLELVELIADTTTILEKHFKCAAFNVGYNQGKGSGASISDHLHVHIVPRYPHTIDSFLNIIGNTRLIEWDFNRLQSQMKPYFDTLQKKYNQQETNKSV